MLTYYKPVQKSEFEKQLLHVKGLPQLVKEKFPQADKDEQLLMMEFCLHGLSEYSQLSKHRLEFGIQFKDLLGSMFNFATEDEREN